MKFKLCSVVAAAAMVLTSVLPLQAAPLAVIDRGLSVATKASSNLVEEVQYYRDDWRGPPPGYYRPPPGYHRPPPGYHRPPPPPPAYRRPPPPPPGWRAGPPPPPAYHRPPPPPPPRYHNGHRGYRDYRPGYREYNGYWYPLAAFAGAMIGGAMNNPPAPRYGGSHHEWCADRYRSYRASDNTYKPVNGPRQQCMSPFMR